MTITYLLCTWEAIATEVPQVIHFSKQQYNAQNQNWVISQGVDKRIYFGNSKGLLCYDGSLWTTYATPGNQIIRSAVCDSSGRVFVGGFATLGYWSADSNYQFSYTSLAEKISASTPISEEIWHILPIADGILFQSFSTIYKYDFKTIEEIRPPGNIMFTRQVNQKVIVPIIKEGLFEYLPDGSFSRIPGSGIFADMRVATIISSGPSTYLVCTQNDGIFEYRQGKFHAWNTPVNQGLKKFQLNKALRLHNGQFAFGTILNGLFVTDAGGNIQYHINQENGLQNNTVLALFEDAAFNLWAGLDKGIDLIVKHSPFVYYQDSKGDIGTVYTAVMHDQHLYVGTNQGIYYKKWPSQKQEPFQLIDGSQGQVWDLQVLDGQVLCGHNKGTFLLRNKRLQIISEVTGGYCLIRHPQHPDILLQGTYTGVVVFNKDERGQWAFSHRLPGFSRPARKILFDADGLLWVIHPHRGLNALRIDPEVNQIIENINWGETNALPTDFGPDITLMEGRVIIKSGTQFMVHQNGHFKKASEVLGVALDPGNYKLITLKEAGYFKVYSDRVVYHKSGLTKTFYLSLVFDHEQIIQLSEELFLFCLDNGYGLLNDQNLDKHTVESQFAPLITNINVKDKQLYWPGIAGEGKPYSFKPTENSLRFFFTLPNYVREVNLRYRLMGYGNDMTWSPYSSITTKEFSNLPPGNFTFQVQAPESGKIASFNFIIKPRWFQTLWAKGLLLVAIALLSWLLYRSHLYRLERHKRRILIQKERELLQQRIQARNEILQAEIVSKSRKIADSTMNLVRKNEILIKIKEDLQQLETSKEQRHRHITRLLHLIDNHLTSEEDWKVFESNFNQLHDQFFKRLKTEFQDLTPGDLRLAAYLKMNLSSKEIAPLLNISIRGVENKRYRLRRKILLDPNVNLTEFLMEY